MVYGTKCNEMLERGMHTTAVFHGSNNSQSIYREDSYFFDWFHDNS